MRFVTAYFVLSTFGFSAWGINNVMLTTLSLNSVNERPKRLT